MLGFASDAVHDQLFASDHGVKSVTTPQRRTVQFGLWWLIALPFLVSPTFLGIEIQQRVSVGLGNARLLVYVTSVVIAYVVACCWIAIRSLDPLNDFRRFPFRGSLLLGAVAGAGFGLQFSLGYGAAHAARGQDDFVATLSMLTSTSVKLTSYGVLGGLIWAWLPESATASHDDTCRGSAIVLWYAKG